MAFGHRLRTGMRGESLGAQLIRGSMGSAGIQMVNRLLALGLGIVLARALGADGYGIYAYAFAILSLLMVASEAGVPTLLMREVAANHGVGNLGLLRGVIVMGSQLVAFMALFVSIIGLLILWQLADGLSLRLLYTASLMLLVLPLAALTKTVAHALFGLQHIVIGQFMEMLLRPLLVLLLAAVIFFIWPGLREPQVAMAAQLVAVVIVLIVSLGVLYRKLPVDAHKAPVEYHSRQWLKSALPFTLIGGAGIIHSQADIIMLGWYRGVDEVGIYRVAVQGAMLVAFGLQAASVVVTPQFSRLYAQGDMINLQRQITLGTRIILLIAVPIALTFVIAGGAIFGKIFGSEFTASHLPMVILSVGQLSLAALGLAGPLLSMTGYETVVSKAMWLSALLNVMLNMFLVPAFGIAGAAWSTAITLTIWNGYLFFLARKDLKINVSPFMRKTISVKNDGSR